MALHQPSWQLFATSSYCAIFNLARPSLNQYKQEWGNSGNFFEVTSHKPKIEDKEGRMCNISINVCSPREPCFLNSHFFKNIYIMHYQQLSFHILVKCKIQKYQIFLLQWNAWYNFWCTKHKHMWFCSNFSEKDGQRLSKGMSFKCIFENIWNFYVNYKLS